MTQHAAQPRLCPKCERAAWRLAENPLQAHVFVPCIHNGVVAAGMKAGGVICAWELSGPMPPERMKTMMKAMVDALDRNDLADAAASTRQ